MLPTYRFVNEEDAKILRCLGRIERDNLIYCNKRTFLVRNIGHYCDTLHYEPFEDGVARVDFGIHPEESAKVYSLPPFIQKTLTFCPACSQDFFNKLVGGMASHIWGHKELKENTFHLWVSKFTNWLIGGQNMPEYKPKYGHWITYTQEITGLPVYFNIQTNPRFFLNTINILKPYFCWDYKYSPEYLSTCALYAVFFFPEGLPIE